MSAKKIAKLLEKALIYDGEMKQSLYEYELEENTEEWQQSLIEDKDNYLFAITENSGHVAMVLFDDAGQSYINEIARDKLKELWKDNYLHNMKMLIPLFARQLNEGEIPINGIKVVKN